MTNWHSMVLLVILNLGLLWLLMAAPIGRRTIRVRRNFSQQATKIWAAIDPEGESVGWDKTVLSSRVLGAESGKIEQTYRYLDRNGQPIRRLLALTRFSDQELHCGFEYAIVEDSVFDKQFWRNFIERRELVTSATGTQMTVEVTDHYRGLLVYLLRYFRLRREMRALAGWLDTGVAPKVGIIEHPLMQIFLASLSTLILWPFFGLNTFGLMMSSFLTVVIVLHELGHMAAYRTFGHKKTRMIFIPLLGGMAIGGRPYNSAFETATCALMGAGMSAFLVPIVIVIDEVLHTVQAQATNTLPLSLFLLTLGAFNLLNLLPMHRFDGGQVLRQICTGRLSLACWTFAIASIIIATGLSIGIPAWTLVASLAIFTLLSLIGTSPAKAKEAMRGMHASERLLVAFGFFAAISLHAYAICYAIHTLF